MYFYEEGECITNSESAMTKPSSFSKDDTEKYVNFQSHLEGISSFFSI